MRWAAVVLSGAFLGLILGTSFVGAGVVDVQLRTVDSPTAADTAASLPTSLTTTALGSTFYLELWMKDLGTPLQGVSGGYLNLAYSTDKLDAVAMNHGSTYTSLATGTMSDPLGLISDFGGGTLDNVNRPGRDNWARLGWVTFTAGGPGIALFTPQQSTSDEFSRFSGGSVLWSQVNAPAASVIVTPEPSSFVLLLAGASLAIASLRLRKWRRTTSGE